MPVNFDHGATGVSRASLAYLAVVATVLADDASLHLVIEGHTDASGDPRTNAMLSWERAFAVFRVLVHRYGIDPQRLQPVGLGSIDPLRPSEPGHAMNRRVQFRIAS
jgi:outer membrane protein OmpA-like peptidoglycan-associated protein